MRKRFNYIQAGKTAGNPHMFEVIAFSKYKRNLGDLTMNATFEDSEDLGTVELFDSQLVGLGDYIGAPISRNLFDAVKEYLPVRTMEGIYAYGVDYESFTIFIGFTDVATDFDLICLQEV